MGGVGVLEMLCREGGRAISRQGKGCSAVGGAGCGRLGGSMRVRKIADLSWWYYGDRGLTQKSSYVNIQEMSRAIISV